jgi:hypothetical protein
MRRDKKIVADADEPTVGVEVVVNEVEVDYPALAIPVEIRHLLIVVVVQQNLCRISSKPAI